MEFLKDPSFVLYSLSYTRTPPSTVISNSSASHQLYADDTQLLLSFSAPDFCHNIPHLKNTITNIQPNGYHPISCLLILLKLSFSSLVYHNNSIILPFIYLTMLYFHLLILLVILVSSLIKICHLRNLSLLFLNRASSIFVI